MKSYNSLIENAMKELAPLEGEPCTLELVLKINTVLYKVLAFEGYDRISQVHYRIIEGWKEQENMLDK